MDIWIYNFDKFGFTYVSVLNNRDKNLISTIKDFKDDLLGRGSGVCTKEDVEW